MVRKRIKSGTALLLGVLGAALAAGAPAQIYKFTDAEGIVHYSNVKPAGRTDFKTFNFPCYASDPSCSQVNWEKVPLNTRSFASEITRAARSNAVDASLIRAIIHAESAYQPDARSPRGAEGLMQLMPAVQAEYHVDNPFDPVVNIQSGTRYLARMLELFDGDVELAAAAYNAGPEAIRRYQGVPPYPETREYVKRITILYRRYRLAGA